MFVRPSVRRFRRGGGESRRGGGGGERMRMGFVGR